MKCILLIIGCVVQFRELLLKKIKRRKQTIRIKSEARYKSKYFDTTTLVNTLLISIRLKAK